MSDLDCCVVTFNCARELIDTSFFARSLHDAISTSGGPPDLLVLALQEIAPIAYSFIGGPYLTPYFSRFEDAVDQFMDIWRGTTIRYELVQTLNVGMTGLMVFAQPDITRNFTRIETASVRVGDYELGNKGAAGIRIGYRPSSQDTDIPLTFIGAHLAPSESAWERRNTDWATIASNMIFSAPSPSSSTSRPKPLSSPSTTSSTESQPLLSSSTQISSLSHRTIYAPHPSSLLLLAGDLNYRTSDLRPHPEDHKTWPSPHHANSNPQLPSSPFAPLLATDQLLRETSKGRTFHGLTESKVTFPPTYKYSDAAQRAARMGAELGAAGAGTSSESADLDLDLKGTEGAWAKHRVPSWCDRILYRGRVKVGKYDALPVQPSSDHRPVVLRFEADVTGAQQGGVELEASPYRIDPDWERRRERSRAKELGVGVLAYLVLTWEGRVLLLGTVVAVVGLGAMGRSWGW
ncbi:hypothetical protein B9Z65_778 [Elsinoe australis]|uniref:Inositol polyphosphate-related phosphatase domain-containing protein n=1 Tax=Elsinoe australis TaxID=40998 RepID=A0A2P8AJH6_9PEZI|nr:hypothetical protein B9Z65_778 [Elsinoe australis]